MQQDMQPKRQWPSEHPTLTTHRPPQSLMGGVHSHTPLMQWKVGLHATPHAAWLGRWEEHVQSAACTPNSAQLGWRISNHWSDWQAALYSAPYLRSWHHELMCPANSMWWQGVTRHHGDFNLPLIGYNTDLTVQPEKGQYMVGGSQ